MSRFDRPTTVNDEPIMAPVNTEILPESKKIPVTKDTQEKLKIMKNEMQIISNEKFLEEISFNNRLKYITEGNIASASISENQQIEFNFSFNSERVNPDLYKYTTAGQVLPESIQSVKTSDGKEYSRKSLKGEFFAQDGKRLIIRDKTQITIGELRGVDQIQVIKNDDTKKLENSNFTEDNKELLTKGLEKGIAPELVLQLFSAFFANKSVKDVDGSQYENFLTEIDRKIGRMNINEKQIDKNNLTEENKKQLEAEMDKSISIENLTQGQKSFPGLNALANRLEVPPEMLHGIWGNESTYSFGKLVIPEPGSRTSYGYFSILGTNHKNLGFTSPAEMNTALNHPDQETRDKNNVAALESYILTKPGLLSALQRKDYHRVAILYNGGNYEKMAKQGNQYDDKLKRAADRYLAA